MILRLTILLLFLSTLTFGQSIRFMETDLETAIGIAKSQNKNIFVDTYASYCNPCKKMDIEFRDQKLASYFNNNFVNVKVNMEKSNADAYKSAYDIVWLPTLLFINPEGDMRMSIDQLITAKDLLKMGKHINGENIVAQPQPAAKPVTPTSPTPEPIVEAKPKANPQNNTTITPAPKKPTETKPASTLTTPEEEGKILYVMGEDSENLPPEILRQEAYFRMQLMDGSHKAAAQKYLATQEDWSTEENMRFIHDFLNDARSKEFGFMIENRIAFENILSKEVVAQSINILVNKELERAYPRPGEQRVKQLLSYTGMANPELGARVYALNNVYATDDVKKFLSEGKALVFEDGVTDAQLLYRYSMEMSKGNDSKKSLKKSMQLAEKSIALDPSESTYHYNAAQIAIMLKNKKKAKAFAQKANRLNEDDSFQKTIDELMKVIEGL